MNIDFVVGPIDNFSENIAKEFGAEFIELEKKVFTDFELRPRVLAEGKNFEGKNVLVVNRQKSGKDADPNKMLVELLFTTKNLSEKNAKVNVLMPYFVYAMQDKIFRAGEPLSAKYVLELLKNAGAKKVFVVSSHMQRKEGKLEYCDGVESYTISAFPVVGKYLKENYQLNNPVVISPDLTAGDDAREVAETLGASVETIEKHRDVDTYESTEKHNIQDLGGKDVVIVDDIAETGGTMAKAIGICKKNNAGKIVCAVVHPVLAGECLERITGAGADFVGANTIDSPISKISVEKIITDFIKKV